jgi:hypothetical protein
MSWLVDNANTFYVLLGIIAVGLLLIWRNNRQGKYLCYTAGVLVVIGLIWLLTRFYVSDSKQLEANVNAMAAAVVAGKADDLFKHVSKDFRYKGRDRDLMYAVVKKAMENHKINDVRISSFRVDELSRGKKFAKTSFRVSTTADRDILFITQADFALESDQWKLITLRFYNPVTQDQELDLPGLR